MKMFEEMTLKKFLIGTARNVGIGVGLGSLLMLVSWLEAYTTFSLEFMIFILLPFALSAIINFFIGKNVAMKILNTFIVGIIAHIVYWIIFFILILVGVVYFW